MTKTTKFQDYKRLILIAWSTSVNDSKVKSHARTSKQVKMQLETRVVEPSGLQNI
jgi:hypothetical protein